MSSTDLNFVRELALAGGGIAALPAVCVARDLESGALVRLLARQAVLPPASLYLVHRPANALSSKVRALRDYLLEAFGAKGRRLSARP